MQGMESNKTNNVTIKIIYTAGSLLIFMTFYLSEKVDTFKHFQPSSQAESSYPVANLPPPKIEEEPDIFSNFDPRYKPRKSKLENIEPDQPVILICNHWASPWPPRPIDFCPTSRQCHLTDDVTNAWHKADMIIYHFNRGPPFDTFELLKMKDPAWKNTLGTANQITEESAPYVFLSWESPHYHRVDYRDKNGYYNYSMTYRLDSEIPMPYGTVWSSKVKYKIKKLEKLNWQISILRILN